jgi:uncharacterized protein YeaO (DUF488 family)
MGGKAMSIQLKRAYETPADSDGSRILVDRLWPRGLSKQKAKIDHWLKEIAPSTELRKWFNHDPEKWHQFKQRYYRELDSQPEIVDQVRDVIKKGDATFGYGAKDEQHNDAVALKEYLAKRGDR